MGSAVYYKRLFQLNFYIYFYQVKQPLFLFLTSAFSSDVFCTQVFRLLLQGEIERVRKLLSLHSCSQTAPFVSVEELLKKMPQWGVGLCVCVCMCVSVRDGIVACIECVVLSMPM